MKIKMTAIGAASAILATSYVSHAQTQTWVRTHGSECMGENIIIWQNANTTWVDGSNFAVTNSDSATQELMCAAPDTSFICNSKGMCGKAAFGTVNVELFAPQPGTFSAKLCEDQWNGNSGTCSSLVSTNGGTGHQTIQLGGEMGVNGAWTDNAGNFGYVFVDVPAGGSIRGIFYLTD